MEHSFRGVDSNGNGEKKLETNCNIISDLDKQNKFRVNNLNDFNIFIYDKQIRVIHNNKILNLIMEDSKSCFTSSKFKIYRVKNKKSSKNAKKRRKKRKSQMI